MEMCRRNLFHYDLRVCTELQVLSKTASRLWFYAYKKYKNGNSARRTSSQRHIRPYICYGGSDNFSSGISGKLPKKATSNAIFLRTTDSIGTPQLFDIQNTMFCGLPEIGREVANATDCIAAKDLGRLYVSKCSA